MCPTARRGARVPGGEEWISEHSAGAPSQPARCSPTVTFPFRAAGQLGGGTGGGRPSCSEGICVFSKLQCWAHPREGIIHLVTSLLGPEDRGEGMGRAPGRAPSSPLQGRLSSALGEVEASEGSGRGSPDSAGVGERGKGTGVHLQGPLKKGPFAGWLP